MGQDLCTAKNENNSIVADLSNSTKYIKISWSFCKCSDWMEHGLNVPQLRKVNWCYTGGIQANINTSRKLAVALRACQLLLFYYFKRGVVWLFELHNHHQAL